MRSNALLISAMILLATLFGYAALSPSLSPSQTPAGRATSSFGASLTVVTTTIEVNSFAQQQIAIANETSTNISFIVDYAGSGSSSVVVAIPQDYTSAQAWYITEDGRTVNVNANSTHLQWNANLSSTSTLLHATLSPPTILITNITNITQEGTMTIIVSSPAHFTNVEAIVPLSTLTTTYPYYKLYELVNGNYVDRTSAYHLTLNNTHAQWSGFSLSTKQFLLDGTTIAPSAFTQASHRRRSFTGDIGQDAPLSQSKKNSINNTNNTAPINIAPNLQSPQAIPSPFTLDQHNIVLNGIEGESKIVELTIINNLDTPIVVTITSNQQAAVPLQTTLHIEHTATVPIKLLMQNARATISVSDAKTTDEAVILMHASRVSLPPQKELPSPLQGSWSALRITNLILCVVLLGVLVLAFVQQRLLKNDEK